MRKRRHAGEAGMRGRDRGNKIQEQEGEAGGGDHLSHGEAHPSDTHAVFVFENFVDLRQVFLEYKYMNVSCMCCVFFSIYF